LKRWNHFLQIKVKFDVRTAPPNNSKDGPLKLREWISQLNACKAQNQQLHGKIALIDEQLEERDNQVSELQAQYLIYLDYTTKFELLHLIDVRCYAQRKRNTLKRKPMF
jgi:hypothetical protein